MPPQPDYNTTRWYVDYTNGVNEHTMLVRTSTSLSDTTFSAVMDDFLTALEPLLNEMTVLAVRVAPKGSPFSSPFGSALVGQVFGTGAANAVQDSTSLNFVGRDAGGVRVKLSVFGYKGTIPTDFRLTTSDSASVAGAVSIMNAAVGQFFTAAEAKPVWYNYANVSINSYWQKENRA